MSAFLQYLGFCKGIQKMMILVESELFVTAFLSDNNIHLSTTREQMKLHKSFLVLVVRDVVYFLLGCAWVCVHVRIRHRI